MNDDPTTPIGGLGPATQGGRAGAALPVPASRAAVSWGSFTLLARVGHGGFGEVYRAWDQHLQREVALKLLLPSAVAGEAEYEAMLREARALASVQHPNIVPVHGIDRHDGRVGFWTDFVRGKTLSALVGEQGTFGAREAALIGLDVARALSAVHRAGLLHRDIKAENVMREEGGRILLMDFGLSSLEQRQTNISGTPNYMAPELFKGGKSTLAADIYAMGVLLYFLVAADYPVHLGGLSTGEALAAIPKRKPLMDLRPDLPESLLRTVSTAMEMDPTRRFQSAGQLANALAESLGTHVPEEISTLTQTPQSAKSGAKWIFAGVLAAAVALGGSLLWLGIRGNASHSATPAAAGSYDDFQKAESLLVHSYKDSNVAEAVKRFQAVPESDPNYALAQARLGGAYFVQFTHSHDAKLLDQAKETTNHALVLDAGLAVPYVTLARIAALHGDTQLATQQANKAIELDKNNAEAYGALGEVYEAEKRPKEALAQYQKAIDLAPDDWRWPLVLAIAKFGQGDSAGATRDLQRAIDKAPDNALAYYDLSIFHSETGQMNAAREDLQNSLKYEETSRAYSALGSLLLLEGNYDDAAAQYKQAIALDSGSYEAWANLGDAYGWAGKQADSVDAFRKAVHLEEVLHEKRRRDPELLITLAFAYAQIGDSEKSMPLVRQALAIAESNPKVEYIAGETYEALHQRNQAIPLFVEALASGYRAREFGSNPRLASLRADPAFTAALNNAKAKKQ
jgi:serine/threonine protein kinase/Tfp pilus assembly protein PilF